MDRLSQKVFDYIKKAIEDGEEPCTNCKKIMDEKEFKQYEEEEQNFKIEVEKRMQDKAEDNKFKSQGWTYLNVLPMNEPGPLPGLCNPKDYKNCNDSKDSNDQIGDPLMKLTTYEYNNLMDKFHKNERTIMTFGSIISSLEEEHIRIKKLHMMKMNELNEKIEQVEEAFNTLAADLKKLQDQNKNQGLSNFKYELNMPQESIDQVMNYVKMLQEQAN